MKRTKLSCVLICCGILLTGCGKNDNSSNDKSVENSYTFSTEFDSFFQNDFISRSGDFIYFAPLGSPMIEYDTKSNKTVEINKAEGQGMTSCQQVYDGKLFSMNFTNTDDNIGAVTFNLTNINTGENECIYTVPQKQGASNPAVSDDGNIFFLTDLQAGNGENKRYDENGYDITDTLCKYNIENKTTEELVEGAYNYCITGDRIYFDRINKDYSAELYYISFDDIIKKIPPTDTKIKVSEDTDTFDSMWRIIDNKAYYSCNSNSLYCTDLESGETQTFLTTDNQITFFKLWKDKVILYTLKNYDLGWHHNIELYDIQNKKTTMVFEEILPSENGFDYVKSELPVGFYADEDMDFFISSIYQEYAQGTRYYKCFADGTKELMLEPDWTYDIDENGIIS